MQVMISYKLKRESLEPNLELLAAVYAELHATRPEGVRYASFQLEDEVSFVDFAETDGPGRFSQLDSFRVFRSGLEERCEELPVLTELRTAGSYNFV
jgi:hypothetical protein